jgi:acetylornithine/succinyldiaminopimelate/putrescine aminotransferase
MGSGGGGALGGVPEEGLRFAIRSAGGCRVTGTDGRTCLDWMAGISVLNTGHRHPKVMEAVAAQSEKHLHAMVYGEWAQEAQSALAERLCGLAPVPEPKVFFTASGAEAVEGAMKAARRATGRGKLVAFRGSYHGDTFGALALTGNPAMRAPFEPLLPGVSFIPFGEEDALKAVDRSTAAVIAEPIQAEGGVRVPPDGFLGALRRRCDETGALLVLDEVQTGLGRTGTMWASEREAVRPDILVLAKALGGGLPLGGFVLPKRVAKALEEGPFPGHLTTFGGHPLSCAAGLAALEVTLAEDLPRNARELGEILFNALTALAGTGVIRAVRGRGLLLGVDLGSPRRGVEVVEGCRKAGLLVGTTLHDEGVLRITPPLIMGDEETVRGLEILTSVLAPE